MDSISKEISSSPIKIVLYSFWQSSCSWRVRFALELKGIPYEYKAVDLTKGEQFSPEFERLNPLHVVPVLVDGDFVVSDSLAILMYLEEKYPENAILPSDLKQKAINLQLIWYPVSNLDDLASPTPGERIAGSSKLEPVRPFNQIACKVASIVSCSIQPRHMLTVLNQIEEKVGPIERQLWAQRTIEKGFFALEMLLKDFGGRYATGDEVCMADVFLAPQISVAITRFNIDMSKFPSLSRIYEAYKVLPAFQASLPERQPDAVVR